jgi:hypothetical protein
MQNAMQLTMSITVSHTYLLRAIEITEFSSYEQKRFFVTAYAGDLLDKSANPIHKHILPLEANLREPTDRNAGVHSILKSISANPNHEIASPIQVVCKSAKFATNSPKRLVLEFEDGQGVLDGSHRLYSLWKAQQNGMDVRSVRVNFMITVGDIDLIARCQELNTYTAPTKISLMNKAGNFDHIKEIYKKDFPFIRYYDGQSGVSKSNLATIQGVDSMILRATGLTQSNFGINAPSCVGSMGRNKNRSGLGIRKDPEFWRLLYDIHPLAVFTLQLLESDAIAGKIRHVRTCNETKAIQLADGSRFNVRLQSVQLFYLLMSSLSVNFDEVSYKETGEYSWHIPLKTIGKQLVKSALRVYKEKSQQGGFQGSASYCMSKPELAAAILVAAENKLSEYIDLNEAA